MTTERDGVRGGAVATQPLRQDNASVETVLQGMAALIARVRERHSVHPLLLAGALTCLEAFQRCHEQKVDAALVPAVQRRDPALTAEAAATLAREHEEARGHAVSVRRFLGESRRLSEPLCRLVDDCTGFFRAHLARETAGLFEAADRALAADDAALLWQEFRRIEEREIRPGEREALRALAAALDPHDADGDAIAPVAGVVAAHVMRPRPRSVRPADTLARALALMDHAGVRELPVAEEGLLRGIVSRSDLQAHLGHLEWTGVEAAMTADPVVVTPERPAAAVTQVLLRGKFNAVPVVADGTTLVGMVSRSDLLRAVADQANGNGHH